MISKKTAGRSRMLALLLCVCMGMTSFGCSKKEDAAITPEQESWIEQFRTWYPDDTFTYISHGRELMGAYVDSCILVKSATYGNFEIRKEDSGELFSFYPNLLHNDAVEEYYEGMAKEYFDCDELSVYYSPRVYEHPSAPISDQEYIEKYTSHTYTLTLYYDGGAYPERETEIKELLSFIEGIESCDITVRYRDPEKEYGDFKYDYQYTIRCADGHIKYFNRWLPGQSQDPEEIFRDIDISEVNA